MKNKNKNKKNLLYIKRSKKSEMNYILVRIIILILSFIILLGFIKVYSMKTSQKANEMECLAYIKGASANIGGINLAALGLGIQNHCKVEKITVDVSKGKDETFRDIANSMKYTWNMFGKGQYNFMDNFKKGNWCFLGAKITFNNGGPIYNYDDFINWLKTNYFMNGSNKVYYSNYLTVNYVTPDSVTKIENEARETFADYKNSQDITSQSMANIMANMYIYYLDRSSKYINTNKKLYVVYRYTTVQMNLPEKLKRTLLASTAGLLGGMVVTGVIEGAVIGFLAGGVGAIPGAIVGGIKGVIEGIKGLFNIGDAAIKVYRFSRFADDVSDSIRFTGETAEILSTLKNSRVMVRDLDDVKYLDTFMDSLSTLTKFGKTFEEGSYTSSDLIKAEKSLNNILKSDDEVNALYKILSKDETFSNTYKSETDFENGLKTLNNDLNKEKQLTSTDKNLLKSIGRASVVLGGGAIAGRLEYLYNPHNLQYVTIMSPEEYYRICGG